MIYIYMQLIKKHWRGR